MRPNTQPMPVVFPYSGGRQTPKTSRPTSRAAHAVDLLDVAPGRGLDLVGEALDEVRPRKRVDGVGCAGLVGQDLLGAEGELGRLLGGQAEGLVEGVGVKALGAAEDGGEGLD